MPLKRNIYIVLSFLFICIVSSFGKIIEFKNCGSNPIQTVDIDPCDVEPCKLKKGSEAKLKQTFTTTGTATKITAKAYGILVNLPPVPYPLPYPDACANSGLECPLEAGNHAYNSSIVIPSAVPEIRLVIKWELRDQNDQIISCFEIPAQVTG